jgi:alginate O-acetyltransferase complex protein AlgI
LLFCTSQFCLFFLIVFAAYWVLPWQRGRVLLLLGASIYFYACWNHWLALLLCVSTLGDYLIARGMEATDRPQVRKLLLLVSLIANLGLLSWFKYVHFFLDSLQEATGLLGMSASMPVLEVIVPVGISFYTFEAINYTVDVYRGKCRAAHDLTHFMLFVLFFPHLVAGPIVRARAFLPLVARRKHWSWLRANTGVLLVLMGVVKKMAIADRIAMYVDPVFADPATFATATLWLALVAYAIQIYCDFSGYSDIALGLAHLLGYHLAQNFNMPLVAPNIAEFWKRWHISLSSWIRDYVFIPLGGSRGTRWQTYRNLVVTFTLCGLWHGAGWNFVVYGFITGLLLVIHAIFKSWCTTRPQLNAALLSPPGTALRIALTFTFFCLTMVLFRIPQMGPAWAMICRLFVPSQGAGLTLQPHGLYLTLAVVALAHVLGQRNLWRSVWDRLPAPVRGLGFGALAALTIVVAPGASKAFIYFQF